MSSLVNELETNGYLTLNKFIAYLKQEHPEAAMSYPTALKIIAEGKLRTIRVGSQVRVTRIEAARWVAEGNFDLLNAKHSIKPNQPII